MEVINFIVLFVVMILSFIVLVYDWRYNPHYYKSYPRGLVWVARIGAMIVSAGSFAQIIQPSQPTNIPSLALNIGFSMILGRAAYRCFHERRAEKPPPRFSDKHFRPSWGIYSVIIALVTSFFWLGPIVEEKLYPVLTEQKYLDIYRVDDAVCFKWTFHKQRNALLEFASFKVVTQEQVAYDIEWTDMTNGLPFQSYGKQKYAAGSSDTIRYCAHVPVKLMTEHDLNMVGEFRFKMGHGLWKVTQNIPVLPIPELM
jgi:hypothetical protein